MKSSFFESSSFKIQCGRSFQASGCCPFFCAYVYSGSSSRRHLPARITVTVTRERSEERGGRAGEPPGHLPPLSEPPGHLPPLFVVVVLLHASKTFVGVGPRAITPNAPASVGPRAQRRLRRSRRGNVPCRPRQGFAPFRLCSRGLRPAGARTPTAF